jgi:hypothetical protein
VAVQTTKKRLERSNTPEAMTLKREKNFNFQVFPQTASAPFARDDALRAALI